MTDRIDIGSFDNASLSPSDYAALRGRIIRQAHAERAKAIAAAFRWLMHHAFKPRHPAARQSAARHAGARRSGPHSVKLS